MPWVAKTDAKRPDREEQITYWCCFCNNRIFQHSDYAYEMSNGKHACLGCAFFCFVDLLDTNTVPKKYSNQEWNELKFNNKSNKKYKKNMEALGKLL